MTAEIQIDEYTNKTKIVCIIDSLNDVINGLPNLKVMSLCCPLCQGEVEAGI